MRLLRVAGMLPALSAGLAQAQGWPARSDRFIVPFPPGGSTDVERWSKLAQEPGIQPA